MERLKTRNCRSASVDSDRAVQPSDGGEPAPAGKPAAAGQGDRAEQKKRDKRIKKIDDEIADLEARIASAERERERNDLLLCSEEVYRDGERMKKIQSQNADLKAMIDLLYGKWEALAKEKEEVESARCSCGRLRRCQPSNSASIIAIGSEMLGPTRVDTNSLKVTPHSRSFGVARGAQEHRRRYAGSTRRRDPFSFAHSDIVITSGGLGPTEDDMTREALAEAFGLRWRSISRSSKGSRQRFPARGMGDARGQQAAGERLRRTDDADNERGTAPGFHIEVDGKHVWVFPGVPHELEWMVETYFDAVAGGDQRRPSRGTGAC